MTTRQLVADEIAEAFRPVGIWQHAAPIERSVDLTLAMQDTLTTLAWWGWAVSVTRARGAWTLQAARMFGGTTVKAKVVGATYPDALWRLGERLQAAMAEQEAKPPPRTERTAA